MSFVKISFGTGPKLYTFRSALFREDTSIRPTYIITVGNHVKKVPLNYNRKEMRSWRRQNQVKIGIFYATSFVS